VQQTLQQKKREKRQNLGVLKGKKNGKGRIGTTQGKKKEKNERPRKKQMLLQTITKNTRE